MSEPTKKWQDCFISWPLFCDTKYWKQHIIICLCHSVFYISRLWQCCNNSLYGLIKRKLCECNNTQQSYILQNCNVCLPCLKCNHSYTVAVFTDGNNNKKTIVFLPWMGRWIYLYSLFQTFAGKWLAKRQEWFIAQGKHSENLKWKGTALILIYICNNRNDSSSYMYISNTEIVFKSRKMWTL